MPPFEGLPMGSRGNNKNKSRRVLRVRRAVARGRKNTLGKQDEIPLFFVGVLIEERLETFGTGLRYISVYFGAVLKQSSIPAPIHE